MDRYSLISRITYIENELPRLNSTLNAMKITDTSSYQKNYEELSMDAAVRAEKIACSLRNLIYAANLVDKPRLMEQVSRSHGIAITQTSGVVKITLPGLMPKRTKYKNTAFLTDPLHYALTEYTAEHPLMHFTECVVCFTHVYNRSLSLGRVLDYDNLECKQLLDTAAAFLMADDSGLLCDAYHTTEFAESDYTLLTIMEKNCFPLWLAAKEDRRKNISDF